MLRRWIQQGAPYEKHWAFEAPVSVEPPRAVAGRPNPVDRFIVARLAQDGLAPSTEADRRTVIRRVTLDLTGLPPTPAEVEAFVEDSTAGAYERLVEQLLSSPRYGEQMRRAIGSTWRGTRIPTACTSTMSARCGRTGTGW